jgi:hypothetical protein
MNSARKRLAKLLGQLRHAREYRLREAGLLISAEERGLPVDMVEALIPETPDEGTPRSQSSSELDGVRISELAISLWRLEKRLVDPATGLPMEDARIAYRHLRAAWDSLTELGVEVLDHTNEEVAEHGITGLRKLAFEPREGLTHETVIETVSPTVVYNGKVVRMAAVIIGVPPKSVDEKGPDVGEGAL